MRISLFLILLINYSKAQFPELSMEKWEKENLKNDTGFFYNAFGDTVSKSFSRGQNGELYVSWFYNNKLWFNASFDNGKTWKGKPDSVFPIRGSGFNKSSLKNVIKPSVVVDTGRSAFKGRIYICWSDFRNGRTNSDVFLIYSDDKGASWIEPILITYYPNHKNQFNPVMIVNPENGNLHILYYDMQNYARPENMDIMLAASNNGGLRFDYYKLNNKPLDFFGVENTPPLFFKDPTVPGWIEQRRIDKGLKKTAVINDSTIRLYNNLKTQTEIEVEKSFNYSEVITVDFKNKNHLNLTAILTKPLEPDFEKIIVKNRKIRPGSNKLLISTKENGLEKGTYILTLYYNNKNQYVWILTE